MSCILEGTLIYARYAPGVSQVGNPSAILRTTRRWVLLCLFVDALIISGNSAFLASNLSYPSESEVIGSMAMGIWTDLASIWILCEIISAVARLPRESFNFAYTNGLITTPIWKRRFESYYSASLHYSMFCWIWGFASLSTMAIKDYAESTMTTSYLPISYHGTNSSDSRGINHQRSHLRRRQHLFERNTQNQGETIQYLQDQHIAVPTVSGSPTDGTTNLTGLTSSFTQQTSYVPSPTLIFALSQILIGPVLWLWFIGYICAKVVKAKISQNGNVPRLPQVGFSATAFSVLKKLFSGTLVFDNSLLWRVNEAARRRRGLGGDVDDLAGSGLSAEELALTKVYTFTPAIGQQPPLSENGFSVGSIKLSDQESTNSTCIEMVQMHDIVLETPPINGVPQVLIAEEPLEPTFKKYVTSEMCSICLGDYEPGELLRELPCGHAFHLECVDAWLKDATVTIEAGPQIAPAPAVVTNPNPAPLPNYAWILAPGFAPYIAPGNIPPAAVVAPSVRHRRGHRECPICKQEIVPRIH